MSPRNVDKTLSKNACSFFLSKTIRLAYETASDFSMKSAKVRAREVRAVATSQRFKYNIKLSLSRGVVVSTAS